MSAGAKLAAAIRQAASAAITTRTMTSGGEEGVRPGIVAERRASNLRSGADRALATRDLRTKNATRRARGEGLSKKGRSATQRSQPTPACSAEGVFWSFPGARRAGVPRTRRGRRSLSRCGRSPTPRRPTPTPRAPPSAKGTADRTLGVDLPTRYCRAGKVAFGAKAAWRSFEWGVSCRYVGGGFGEASALPSSWLHAQVSGRLRRTWCQASARRCTRRR
jgi:hypothetical protein